MKVFLSWSGARSRHIAETLRAWLPRIVQAIRPWMSDVDIPAGARWQTDVAHELDAADFGIICVTPENVDKPWLLFEAGALSKSMKNSRVCPLVFLMELSDVHGPIAQFQGNKLNKHGVFQILKAINSAVSEGELDPDHLQDQFDLIWPKIDQALSKIPSYEAPKKHADQEKPLSAEHAEEIIEKFLERVSSRNAATFPISTKNESLGIAEDRAKYVTNTESIIYAPVSNLEGAIISVIVRRAFELSFKDLLLAVFDDLELWKKAGAVAPRVCIDLPLKNHLNFGEIDALRNIGINFPNAIEVRITEEQVLEQTVVLLANQLTEHSIAIGLKNFGTGYSSLSHLRELPISTIWIDASFVQEVVESVEDKSIVGAISSLADTMGARLVAEGVNTAEQSRVLLECGVKIIAGSMAGDIMSGREVLSRIST